MSTQRGAMMVDVQRWSAPPSDAIEGFCSVTNRPPTMRASTVPGPLSWPMLLPSAAAAR
ncbi:hypothetical protein ACFQ10_48770 [Streptomyces indonesiensis]